MPPMSLYPASPPAVPTTLTSPSAGYLARALLVLVGLAAFVALYVGICVALVLALRELWELPVRGRAAIYVLGGGTLVILALLLFLLKGLLFHERTPLDGLVEVTRAQQPRLFEFIDRLIAETGAPRPRKVYLSPDVNAAVFYEPSILSLVLPTPKSLVIGLGLVNHLTLSELKAVLGHELGHFSQRAMKLGTYVYTAQRVVANLVYGRDAFDQMLDEGKRADPRIAIVAWIIGGVVWALRGVLRVAFEIVALGHRALGREMEFAADRMAVAVAGGDALARGLYKAELADACFGATVGRLVHAADQGLVTDDFFFHQARAIGEVRARAERPRWGEPDDRQDGFLFAADASSQPSMWATHPPSAERERAARSLEVEVAHDERPAWLLFDDEQALRAQLTTALVRQHIPHAAAFPRAAAEVEEILESERRETEIVERAGEMYAGRLLAKLDLDALFARTPRTRDELAAAHAALSGEELERLKREFRETQETLQLLARAQAGQLRETALIVDGGPRRLAEVPELLEERLERMKEIDDGFEALDRRIAEVHAEMAITVGERATRRLRRAYADVLRYGRWITGLRDAQSEVGPYLARLQRGEDLGERDSRALLAAMEAVRAETARIVGQAKKRKAPKFLGLAPDAKLGSFLLAKPAATALGAGEDAGSWLGLVLSEAAEVNDKLLRLHHRSVAKLLHTHADVFEAWSAGAELAGVGAGDDDSDEGGDADEGAAEASARSA